jgi:hypothetical protein
MAQEDKANPAADAPTCCRNLRRFKEFMAVIGDWVRGEEVRRWRFVDHPDE